MRPPEKADPEKIEPTDLPPLYLEYHEQYSGIKTIYRHGMDPDNRSDWF